MCWDAWQAKWIQGYDSIASNNPSTVPFSLSNVTEEIRRFLSCFATFLTSFFTKRIGCRSGVLGWLTINSFEESTGFLAGFESGVLRMTLTVGMYDETTT